MQDNQHHCDDKRLTAPARCAQPAKLAGLCSIEQSVLDGHRFFINVIVKEANSHESVGRFDRLARYGGLGAHRPHDG